MKHNLILPTILIGVAFSGASLAHQDTTKQSMAGHSQGSMELHRIMAKSHNMPMPMAGDVDKDFASMMTMHHQQAIEMADVLIRTGKSAELKAMARKMKADQQAEIKALAKFAGPMNPSGMKMGKMDHGKMAVTEFASLDANKDGKIGKGEVPSTNPLSQHFSMLDADKDGSLNRSEFAKFHGM